MAGVDPVTTALLGDERWHPRIKANPRPSAEDLANYLDTFGSPALEHGARYLARRERVGHPEAFEALARLFLRRAPERGRALFAAGYLRTRRTNPALSRQFLDGVVRLRVTELLSELRADFDAATDDEGRVALRFALLELKEPRLHTEARAALMAETGSPDELAAAVETCLGFMGGDHEVRLMSLFTDFGGTRARLAILRQASSSRWAAVRADPTLAPEVRQRLDEVVEKARRREALVR